MFDQTFNNFTDLCSEKTGRKPLSGELYVTVSYVKPVLHLFGRDLLKEKEQDTQLKKELKTTIMPYLDEKYANSATDDGESRGH